MATLKINRRKMTSDDNYIYTKARAALILGKKNTEIEFVYVVGDGYVLIGLFNDSIYLTEKDFKVSYAQERKARSRALTVTQRLDDECMFTVRNENKKTAYTVDCLGQALRCNCPDFDISTKVMKTDKVCCKHGYAVLGILGYGSLKEYICSDTLFKQSSR